MRASRAFEPSPPSRARNLNFTFFPVHQPLLPLPFLGSSRLQVLQVTMGLDSRSRPSVLWMKSIPVRVEGPALTSGQSPTYYEYNNGLTGIIEHLRSSRSIALLYPLCWFMTPCDGEEDSSGTRVPCATQWGKKSESLLFSFFPPCVARSPTSPRRAIGSRAIDFVLASAGARREGSTFSSTSRRTKRRCQRSIENLYHERVKRGFMLEPANHSSRALFHPLSRVSRGEKEKERDEHHPPGIFRRAVKTFGFSSRSNPI